MSWLSDLVENTAGSLYDAGKNTATSLGISKQAYDNAINAAALTIPGGKEAAILLYGKYGDPKNKKLVSGSGGGGGGGEEGGASFENAYARGLAEQYLAWAKGAGTKLMGEADKTFQRGDSLWNLYQQYGLPLDKAVFQEALAGTDAERERARAGATARLVSGRQIQGLKTDMQRYGLSPESPAYQARVGSAEYAKTMAEIAAREAATRGVAEKDKLFRANVATGLGSQRISQSAGFTQLGGGLTQGAAGIMESGYKLPISVSEAAMDRSFRSAMMDKQIGAQFDLAKMQMDFQKEMMEAQQESQMWSDIFKLGGTALAFGLAPATGGTSLAATPFLGGNPFESVQSILSKGPTADFNLPGSTYDSSYWGDFNY